MKKTHATDNENEGRLGGASSPNVPCRNCGGGGHVVSDETTLKCPDCGGTGMVLPPMVFRKKGLR